MGSVIFNTVTEQIEWDAQRDTLLHKVVFDLKTVNDSQWKLRFRLNILTSEEPTSSGQRIFIGISDSDENVGASVAQNAIYLQTMLDAGNKDFELRAADNQGLNSGGIFSTLATDPDVKVYYVELERVSFTVGNDTVICRLFDNPSYEGTPIEEEIIELTNAFELAPLRYFFVTSLETGTTVGGSHTGTVTDVEFWNNTNQQDNRIATLTDHFDDASLYTQISTGVTVDDSSFPKQIFFNSVNDGTDRRVFRKLPFALSDEKWVIDFDWEPTAQSQPGHMIMALTQNSNDPFNVNDNPIITAFQTDVGVPAGNGLAIAIGEGTGNTPTETTDGNNTIPLATGVKGYARLIRIDRSRIRLELYSDPERTVLVGSVEGTTNVSADLVANIKNLSYVNAGTISVGGGARVITGTVQNLKIYNGVNTVDAEAIPDFPEDFADFETQVEADESWPSRNVTFSRVNLATDVLDFQVPQNSVNASILHDLQKEIGKGNFLDDNQWLIRFKLRWSTLNFVSTGLNHNFGLTRKNSKDTDFDGRDTFMEMTYNHGNAGNSTLGSSSRVAGVHSTGVPIDESVIRQLAVATDFFFEIARTSKTSGYVRFFGSDPTFKNIVEEFKFTNVDETVSGLRYFKFTHRVVTAPGLAVGTLDDLEVWNGVCIPNDADKIRVKLEDCGAPGILTENKIRWRAKSTAFATRAKAQLWEDGVLIAESLFIDLTPDYRDYEYELTVAEVNSVLDFNKLSIVIVPDTVE